jgi:hypothetical protein
MRVLACGANTGPLAPDHSTACFRFLSPLPHAFPTYRSVDFARRSWRNRPICRLSCGAMFSLSYVGRWPRTDGFGMTQDIEMLLSSMKGLETISPDLSGFELVSAGSIIHHAAILRCLDVGICEDMPGNYKVSELSSKLSACTHLNQLGVHIGMENEPSWHNLCRNIFPMELQATSLRRRQKFKRSSQPWPLTHDCIHSESWMLRFWIGTKTTILPPGW